MAGMVGRVVLVAVVAGPVDAPSQEGRHGNDEQRVVPCLALPRPPLDDLPFSNGQ